MLCYNKKVKKKIILAVILFFFLIGILYFYFQSNNLTVPGNNQGVKFAGIITETNNGCWADGVCSIKIDDKWITAETGGLRPPNSKPEIRGQLIGISFSQDTNKYIGKRAGVYAKQTDGDNFTIYGNESYYIKLLE